jgi:hypothetical protein
MCVWQDELNRNGYTACTCVASPSGGKAWSGCVGQGSLEYGKGKCPLTQPEPQSTCNDYPASKCFYPFATCACGDSGGTWSCTANPKPDPSPREVKPLCLPGTFNENKQVKDLTDAEARAWCAWYVNPEGRLDPPPVLKPTDLDAAVADLYGTTWTEMAGMPACIEMLPLELCLKNLRVHPCDATVAELDECVQTFLGLSEDANGPGWVGHGCAPYLSHAACNQIIVRTGISYPDRCALPLQ